MNDRPTPQPTVEPTEADIEAAKELHRVLKLSRYNKSVFPHPVVAQTLAQARIDGAKAERERAAVICDDLASAHNDSGPCNPEAKKWGQITHTLLALETAAKEIRNPS